MKKTKLIINNNYKQGVVPIIRCPRNSMSEHIAQCLDKKFRDYLVTSNVGSSDRMDFTKLPIQRPGLLIELKEITKNIVNNNN